MLKFGNTPTDAELRSEALDPERERATDRGLDFPLIIWRSSASRAEAVESAPAAGP